MIRLLLTGMLAAQVTALPTPSPSPSRCRAADGRYVLSCFPRGTVVKMKPRGRLRVSEMPAATPPPAREAR